MNLLHGRGGPRWSPPPAPPALYTKWDKEQVTVAHETRAEVTRAAVCFSSKYLLVNIDANET